MFKKLLTSILLVAFLAGQTASVDAATSKTFNDVVDTFAYHYQKHSLDELPKAGKPIVSQQQYFDDAVKFWEQNESKGFPIKLADKTEGIKIDTYPGGIYTKDGKVVSFWYTPKNP